jgi:hypothetical protein
MLLGCRHCRLALSLNSIYVLEPSKTLFFHEIVRNNSVAQGGKADFFSCRVRSPLVMIGQGINRTDYQAVRTRIFFCIRLDDRGRILVIFYSSSI